MTLTRENTIVYIISDLSLKLDIQITYLSHIHTGMAISALAGNLKNWIMIIGSSIQSVLINKSLDDFHLIYVILSIGALH